jgi:GT2 family glycosyltransferase
MSLSLLVSSSSFHLPPSFIIEMQTNPLIHVIILNWNHLEDLKLTIDSFLKQDYVNSTIIVADNGSSDGSIDYLMQLGKGIILIENKENLGYAAGNNVAIKWSLKQNPDLILLVNNDIYIDDNQLLSNVIKRFLSCYSASSGIFGIQERNYFLQSKIENEGYFLFDDLANTQKQFNTIRARTKEQIYSPYKYVDFVSGSFILIKREVFERCGLLDEAFFMYHEEAEFCFRAWNKGFNVIVDPSIHYYHKVALSAGTDSPFSLYYRVRNNFYFLHKHKKNIKFYSRYISHYSFQVILQFIKLSVSLLIRYRKNKGLWKALIKAIIDARKHVYYKHF